jgi:hypothetical protein
MRRFKKKLTMRFQRDFIHVHFVQNPSSDLPRIKAGVGHYRGESRASPALRAPQGEKEEAARPYPTFSLSSRLAAARASSVMVAPASMRAISSWREPRSISEMLVATRSAPPDLEMR